MVLIFDCESTGLDVFNDYVWCVVAKDFNTGQVYEFRPDELDQVEKLFSSAEKLCCHNLISYDREILKNNGIVDIPFEKCVDTLVLSRLLYPDRDGHSVEAWGKRLGRPKVSHETWDTFSEEMLHRCREDVEIQMKIYQELLKEKGDWDWTLAENIEHNVQKILFEQEVNGWKFDVERAKELVSWLESEMEKLEQEIVPKLPLNLVNKGEVKKPFKRDGNLTKQAEEWTQGKVTVRGPFTRVEWNPIRLSQREKLANALIYLGWKPSSYTAKGKPQITPDKNPCPNLEKLGDIGPKLSRYYLCSHRKGQISGWLEHVREDGRLPSIAIGNSTNTGRMAHRVIANVPKASESVFLGKEMRDLFIHKEGYKLVGWDAEGLELRVLAHYMNDDEFTKAVTQGRKEDKTDIHNLMLRASDGIVKDRDTVKNCVPMDTLALTREGWKSYHDLQEGMEILTFNREENRKEWSPIRKLHYFENQEVIEVFHKQHFKIRATKDHRWVVRKRKWLSDKNRWNTRRPYMVEGIETTDELNTESNIVVNAPMKNDSGYEIDWRGNKYDRDWTKEVCQASSDARKSFLSGFLIADGWNDGKGGWKFSQNRNEFFEAALTAAAIEHDGYLYVNTRENGVCSVNLSKKQHVTMQNSEKQSVGKQSVWCVTTDNDTWVMRQGDVITITGNCVYAIVYGAGDWKLGSTAGYTKGAKAKGKELRKKWSRRFPKLESLVNKVTKASERGYLIAIDGRKVWMRRDPSGKTMSHKGLNTLIQSTGSVIIKMAVSILRHLVEKEGLRAYNVIIYHDEVVAEVHEKDVDRYRELCYNSMKMTGKRLEFKCPLSIEVKSGRSWGEVHG